MTSRMAYLTAGGALVLGAGGLVIFFFGTSTYNKWVLLAFSVICLLMVPLELWYGVKLGKRERRRPGG
jgi:hypothetical protein